MMTDLTTRPYRVTDSQPVFDGPQGRATEDQLLYPCEGRLAVVLRVVEPATARVVAVTPNARVVLWWRWDHPTGSPILELPGAGPDPACPEQDTPAGAARWGLRAAGWAATSWDALTELRTATGVSTRAVHVYLARGLYRVPTMPTADTAAHSYPWAVAVEMAADGALEATSAAAVLLADHRRRTPGAWADAPPDPGPPTGSGGVTGVLGRLTPLRRRYPDCPLARAGRVPFEPGAGHRTPRGGWPRPHTPPGAVS